MEAGNAAGVPTVHTLADLRRVPTVPIPQRQTYYVRMSSAFFSWEPTSSLSESTDDANSTQSIVPVDRVGRAGRWIVTGVVGDPWSPLTFTTDLYEWLRADTEIPATPIATWGNAAGTTRDLSQGTGAAQPVLVNPDSRFNNRPAVAFDGTDDFLAASAAADWKPLHDGTGFGLLLVFHVLSGSGTKVIFDTLNGTAANVGMAITFDATNEKLSVQVANGGANVILYTGANGSCLKGATHVLTMTYAEGRTPNEYEIRLNRVEVQSGNSLAAPNAGNPNGPLTLGRFTVASGGFLPGEIGEIVVVERGLATSDLQMLEAYAERFTA